MGLIQDHQVCVDADPLVHRIVKLVSEDLCGTHYHRGIRILLSVACENATIRRAEFMAELLVDGIGKGLKG